MRLINPMIIDTYNQLRQLVEAGETVYFDMAPAAPVECSPDFLEHLSAEAFLRGYHGDLIAAPSETIEMSIRNERTGYQMVLTSRMDQYYVTTRSDEGDQDVRGPFHELMLAEYILLMTASKHGTDPLSQIGEPNVS